MKKLVLGLGILALSAASFSAIISKDINVNVTAEITGTGGQEVFLYSSPGTVPLLNIPLEHAPTQFGERIQSINTTIVAMLKPIGGGDPAISLIQGTDTIVANFGGLAQITLELANLNGQDSEFTSELFIGSNEEIANNRKVFTITSSPNDDSASALAGTYSGSETLTVTINKTSN